MNWHVLGCRGAFPAPNEGTSAHLIQVDGKNILVDCGSGALSMLSQLSPLTQIHAVVISHLHADHCCELPLLGYALANHVQQGGAKVPLYLPDEPILEVDRLKMPAFSVHTLPDKGDILIPGGLHLYFWPTKHPVAGRMLRFVGKKTFAYSGDTVNTPDLLQCARYADLFVCNAATVQTKPPNPAHISAREAGEVASHAQVKVLLLSHCMPAASASAILAEARRLCPPAQSAVPGWKLT